MPVANRMQAAQSPLQRGESQTTRQGTGIVHTNVWC
jgi:hypothetical protein